ncbi:MAG: DNA-directed RNA polymerase subunit B [Candidatus Nanohalarchaeota archaeon]|nr:MAG: DNA-directed RNA polymerase subunit B [Candidatus Nanohaloarchaeota archaeon]
MGKVYIDGKYMGECNNTKQFVQKIREERRSNNIPLSLNVAFKEKENQVDISLDRGRIRRPLIVVKKGKSTLTEELKKEILNEKITWTDLEEKGVVEYIDAAEEENAYIALKEESINEKHTHLEIDASLVLGASASQLPFPEMNRGDRLNYGSRMILQASGLYLQNYHLRTDTNSYLLMYPQKPLCAPKISNVNGSDTHPAGQNLVIALMPFMGYNIEDALIVNKASIERGLGRSFSRRCYSTLERKYWGGQEDEIGLPREDIIGRKQDADYAKLDSDGIISPGQKVGMEEVLIAKSSPLRFVDIEKEIHMGISNMHESSIITSRNEPGRVERVIVTSTEEGEALVKVIVREHKIPEIGDKFATRHGQKSVVGMVVPEEDMPVTANGLTPDVIFNPHAIPSRMTVGQLMEIIAGKYGALVGEEIDATVFGSQKEKILEGLDKLGFNNNGKETLYDGRTGKKIESEILMGVVFYQRLYQLSSHKLYSRSKGPVTLLTRQPTEGRSKGGGLRLGEMEKDCILAHGAAISLHERFSCDHQNIKICRKCGVIAIMNIEKGKYFCPICMKSDIGEIKIPSAFKLLIDEMVSMMIYPKIITEN